MKTRQEPDTEELIDQVARGDLDAGQQLLARHRRRLRRMVAVRLDRRLAARIDPSDVVQDTLTKAALKLSEYVQSRPLPFYPWLRQLAFERLVELNRLHVRAKKRSINREQPGFLELSAESAAELASRLTAVDISPSQSLLRHELRVRVQDALQRLPSRDREVLVLRHLEFLSARECAAALGLTESGFKSRHIRALDRLRDLLESGTGDKQ
jgi:RNA polymerase sigma-70 factor (ECF subfamily)